METLVDEIAPDIYRLSTYVEAAGLVPNQYLVVAEQPLLFHCGGRQLFGHIRSAVDRTLALMHRPAFSGDAAAACLQLGAHRQTVALRLRRSCWPISMGVYRYQSRRRTVAEHRAAHAARPTTPARR